MIDRFIVMGASGCGKSFIGTRLAAHLHHRFQDADALHPAENVEKMRRGDALTDQDRLPWLARVGAALEPNTVIACSALRRNYRDLIAQTANAPVLFVCLTGDRDTLIARVGNRPGHYMPPSLVDSQLATLELPTDDEAHLTLECDLPPDEIINRIVATLG